MFPRCLRLQRRRTGRRRVQRQRARDNVARTAFPAPDEAELRRELMRFVGEDVLVAERGLEAELAPRASGEAIAHAREVACGVQIAVQEAVRFFLHAWAEDP